MKRGETGVTIFNRPRFLAFLFVGYSSASFNAGNSFHPDELIHPFLPMKTQQSSLQAYSFNFSVCACAACCLFLHSLLFIYTLFLSFYLNITTDSYGLMTRTINCIYAVYAVDLQLIMAFAFA